MREASSRHEDVLSRRKAVDVEVRRLKQQAEDEVRVASVARRLSQEHPQQQPRSVRQQQQQQQRKSLRQHRVEFNSDSDFDWEPGQADDADVVYPWERFDDRGRPLPEQQQQQQPSGSGSSSSNSASSVYPPEPKTPDEASVLLAQFRPVKTTPEDLRRLLEARADPNIVIPTETYGEMSPLEKAFMALDKHVPIFFYNRANLIHRTVKCSSQGVVARISVYSSFIYAYILGRRDARPAAGVRCHEHKKVSTGLDYIQGQNGV